MEKYQDLSKYESIKANLQNIIDLLEPLSIDEQIDSLNFIKETLHEVSPMRHEPVDCVLWVRNDVVKANDYNPNSVAPPEMDLLKQSILEDGYTQPIVSFKETDSITVVDGFHRNRVGKEVEEVKKRVFGRLPVVNINQWKQGRGDRMASTIRHNRARGSHNVELMSTIVSELVEMGKGDAWICKHVGMTSDELLRMKQITGLASLFKDQEFSQAWESDEQ